MIENNENMNLEQERDRISNKIDRELRRKLADFHRENKRKRRFIENIKDKVSLSLIPDITKREDKINIK